MFLGDELTEILEAIENDTAYDAKEQVLMKVGVHVLPRFPKDTTDRNRTSPFAFTGNRFEFRMLGSAVSIADANIVLNTIVAEELSQFADTLETAADFQSTLHELIRKTIRQHKRIIFNGDGYDEEWKKEAQRRGLLNLESTPDCLPYFVSDKNIALFTKHRVFAESEMRSRYEILLENYSKVLNIEALTMLDMARKDIFPAVCAYIRELGETVAAKKAALPDVQPGAQGDLCRRLSSLADTLYDRTAALESALLGAKKQVGALPLAQYYQHTVLTAMQALRTVADEIETLTAKSCWPYPSYGDLLFSV